MPTLEERSTTDRPSTYQPRALWGEIFYVFGRNLSLLLLVITLAFVAEVVNEFLDLSAGGQTVINTVLWSMLAYGAHATILLDKSGYQSMSDNKKFLGFWLRALGLTMTGAITMLIITPALLPELSRAALEEHIVRLIIAALLVISVIFGCFGTWLPAVVDGGNTKLGAAFARGRKTFFYAVPRLLLAPGVLLVATLTIVTAAATIAPQSLEPMIDPKFVPNIYAIGAFLFLSLNNALTYIATAVILSRAYLRAEGRWHAGN